MIRRLPPLALQLSDAHRARARGREQPHIAVTFLPLACTGATIERRPVRPAARQRLPAGSRHRDLLGHGAGAARASCRSSWLDGASPADPDRKLDLVLLTVGANDIKFAGLVADVIVERRRRAPAVQPGRRHRQRRRTRRKLSTAICRRIRQAAHRAQAAGRRQSVRVVFVSYGNPAMQAEDKPCPGGRDGLDVHPAFGADGERLRDAADFVRQQIPAEDQGAGALRGRQGVPRSRRPTA